MRCLKLSIAYKKAEKVLNCQLNHKLSTKKASLSQWNSFLEKICFPLVCDGAKVSLTKSIFPLIKSSFPLLWQAYVLKEIRSCFHYFCPERSKVNELQQRLLTVTDLPSCIHHDNGFSITLEVNQDWILLYWLTNQSTNYPLDEDKATFTQNMQATYM